MRSITAIAVALAVTGTTLMLCPFSGAAAESQSIGARYGSREPARCSSMTEPATGAPTSAQAAQYVRCTMEGESTGPALTLLQDLDVRVAAQGRAYNSMTPISDADPEQPVYDIRGSYVRYQCDPVYAAASGTNVGRNCNTYAHAKAVGVCWKTTFGDWGCTLTDPNATSSANQKREQAPPA